MGTTMSNRNTRKTKKQPTTPLIKPSSIPRHIRIFHGEDWPGALGPREAYFADHLRWIKARREYEAEHGLSVMAVWERYFEATKKRWINRHEAMSSPDSPFHIDQFVEDEDRDPRWDGER
jgi:hypothetical protein